MFARVIDSLANVLPNEAQYHQLQRHQLLLSTELPARAATSVVDLDQPMPTTVLTLDTFRPPSDAMNAKRAELVRTVKASLDDPLTDAVVTKSWLSVYYIAAIAGIAAIILVLVAWYKFW